MNDEDVAARLAEALADWSNLPPIARMVSGQRAAIAAALLPVVREIADQRAAEELRVAANDVRQHHGTASGTAERIGARAAALRGEAGR